MLPKNYWELPIPVLPEDIDGLGHVNNVVYFRYAQDVAISHWSAIATEEQKKSNIWVVGRHEIDYRKPILPEQEVLGLTWVHRPEGMRFYRSVWLVNPEKSIIFAQVKTTWLLLNAETGRPKRIDEKLLQAFEKWMVE